MKLSEVGGVGIVTKQNATKDVPVGGEYMNVKKLGLGSGKPKLHDKKATKNTTPNKLFNLGISEDMAEGKRVPRKKGQPAGSKKHSDLYTDENPKGTIHGLKFATVKDAKASVNKIKRSGKKHAHKIQAAIAMEQRAKAAGKVSAAAVYRKYINAMKKKTKKMNELRIERPDPKDTLGVKRKDMPQIKSDDYNLFYAYLKKNGAKFTKDTMPASELRAMQKEFSDEGIMKQMRKNNEQGPNTKAVIVSSDGYIMDGHHRWLVALNTGSDLNVMRVNMPAFELYDLVNKFEKTYYKDMYDSVEMGETRGSIGVPLASGLVVSVFPHRPLRIKKSTPGKLRYDETLDEEIADWFADKWQNIFEKWSAKYKKSIDCNNPKGFSQRAHCAGRKKKKSNETKEAPPGTYFTKSGNLVKGRLTKDARERGARETDPKDATRSRVPPVTQYNESFLLQQKGFKKKGNRMVPNCVKEEETDSLGSQINFPGYEKKDEPKKPKKKQKPKSMYDKIVGTFTSAFNLDEGINDPHIFKAVFMAGGPGSGKGFVAQNLLGGTGLRTVNSDDMYEYLLKKQDLALDPATIGSPQGQEIRQRAKTLIKSREAQYIDGRIGLVIDGTGKDPNIISKHVNKLREVGYDVAMIFVNTSLEVAQQRNQKRERTLPRDMVTQLWNEVQENIMKFQQIFRPDRFFVIDNSGGLEDLDRKENFDKVYNETQRFLNTPPSKKAALAWIQQQKEQNDAERSAKQQQNKEPDGGTTDSN
ncbi:MAG: hypothetical protein CMF52_03660 [Legionellales bacterium]|nr:hypothetical protein [Legionellales bacterium]